MTGMRKFLVPAVAVLLLAGCASVPSEPDAVVSPSSTPTSAPIPTPTLAPTPVPEPRQPLLEELIVSPDGIGNVRMGEIPVAGGVTDIVAFDPEHCTEIFANAGWDEPLSWDPSRWVPLYPEEETLTGSLRGPFEVSVDEAAGLRSLYVWSPLIKTDRGAHIGMPEDEFLALHPEGFDEVVSRYDGAALYVIDGPNGRLSFEIHQGADEGGAWGDMAGKVWSIRVTPVDSPLYIAANSDRLGSRCSLA